MLMLPEISMHQGSDLLHMVRSVSETLDLDEVTRRCLKFMVRLLAGQGGIITLRNEYGDFYVANELGIDPDRHTDFEGLLGQLIAFIGTASDIENDAQNKEKIETIVHQMARNLSPDWRQTIPIALSFEQNLLGVVFVFRSYESEVTEFLGSALHALAEQSAIAIHHATLFHRVQHERRRLAILVEHSAEGILLLDADLCVENLNPAMELMTGWNSLAAEGNPYEDILKWSEPVSWDVREAVQRGWPENHETETRLHHEGEIIRRDGLPFYIGVSYTPILDHNERKLLGVIANVQDLNRKKLEREQQNLFISTISHELKTPVALIKGYANTLLRADAEWDRNTSTESLTVIDEEADRLSHLIDDLLHASRLEALKGFVLEKSEVHIPTMLATLVEHYRKQSARHSLSLKFSPDFPCITADPNRIKEVFENLISNALKYSPQGGEIEIGGESREEEVLLFVRDEGMGIEDSEKERIFERFYRVDNTLSRSSQGAGLGLYLVQSIIKAHQGRLHLSSNPGRGAIFYFTLPIQPRE
ncbi:MAG: ATP-binding protein [Anaerolineaceae bacterium]|nr:ATP-binding protein [Anaerolineaceae bacterium]